MTELAVRLDAGVTEGRHQALCAHDLLLVTHQLQVQWGSNYFIIYSRGSQGSCLGFFTKLDSAGGWAWRLIHVSDIWAGETQTAGGVSVCLGVVSPCSGLNGTPQKLCPPKTCG